MNTAYYRLSKEWCSASLTHQLKFSVLLHGCETWSLAREDLARPYVLDTSCRRRILRVYWWMKTSIQTLSKQRAITEMIEFRRSRYPVKM